MRRNGLCGLPERGIYKKHGRRDGGQDKKRVRASFIAKLVLDVDSCAFDIGAGPVRICEMAGTCTRGHVYAIAFKMHAADSFRKNQKSLVNNISVVEAKTRKRSHRCRRRHMPYRWVFGQ